MSERNAELAYTGGGRYAATDEWYTPDWLPACLGPWDLDPCAGPKSHAAVNIRRPACGLSAPWTRAERVWLNPPYSDLDRWLGRLAEHGNGIALVPARAETKWFQIYASRADALLLLQGRIRFESPRSIGAPPIGSALLAFGARNVAALAAAVDRDALRGVLLRGSGEIRVSAGPLFEAAS